MRCKKVQISQPSVKRGQSARVVQHSFVGVRQALGELSCEGYVQQLIEGHAGKAISQKSTLVHTPDILIGPDPRARWGVLA